MTAIELKQSIRLTVAAFAKGGVLGKERCAVLFMAGAEASSVGVGEETITEVLPAQKPHGLRRSGHRRNRWRRQSKDFSQYLLLPSST